MAQPGLNRLLIEAYRALAEELAAEMADRGYSEARAGHAAVFTNIDRRSGTRLTELARRARVTKQAMMLLVDELEARGFVRRVKDSEDARAKVVRLTARGRNYAAEMTRAIAAVEQRVKRQLGERRHQMVRAALEELRGPSDQEESA